jgi:hypothetical protein
MVLYSTFPTCKDWQKVCRSYHNNMLLEGGVNAVYAESENTRLADCPGGRTQTLGRSERRHLPFSVVVGRGRHLCFMQ